MIKTLAPYSDTERTAEILSRYRPIAPKPENPAADNSPKITHSPYLRNLWPQLQARPTRTRKRGRATVSPPAFKRTRAHHNGIYSPVCFNFPGFTHGGSQLPLTAASGQPDLVTLPLLPCCPEPRGKPAIDLNAVAETPDTHLTLQSPTTNVVSPRPIRPIGSTVKVGCITKDPDFSPPFQTLKTAEEVEKEVESETLPAIICDSNYRVRLANSAYKELVGQPECSWLDSIVAGKRICGEVALHLGHSEVPSSPEKFFCWVNVEWGHEGRKKTVHAFCDVVRLSCLSKDYIFSWRFHTRGSSEGSSSNA